MVKIMIPRSYFLLSALSLVVNPTTRGCRCYPGYGCGEGDRVLMPIYVE